MIMTTQTHLALLLPDKRAKLTIARVPDVSPGAGEIAVRVRALAVNPFDRYVQAVGDVITAYLAYPAVLGSDVAGEVLAVGPGVTRFRVGDRVLGHAGGIERSRNNAAEGGFQEIVLLQAHMASPIPADLPFENAAVLPLGLSTAACGLFQKDFLALAPPRVEPIPTGEVLLVWGGASSVGSNAIQLARAAGYDVATTCSPGNFEYVRQLGATYVFDYRRPSVQAEIVDAMRGRQVVGAMTIGKGAAAACMRILARCEGRRFVAQVSAPASLDDVPAAQGRWRKLLPALARMVAGGISLRLMAKRTGLKTKMIWGGALMDNEVGMMIYGVFLPEALSRKAYAAMPPSEVVGHGLQYIPEAMARQRRGVSARKLVVTL